jgi:hypothetical protein
LWSVSITWILLIFSLFLLVVVFCKISAAKITQGKSNRLRIMQNHANLIFLLFRGLLKRVICKKIDFVVYLTLYNLWSCHSIIENFILKFHLAIYKSGCIMSIVGPFWSQVIIDFITIKNIQWYTYVHL